MKLGVIGGLGSYSSCYFYKRLLDKIKANCDQDYIDMVILNHASMPDRTKYLLDRSSESPIEFLKSDIHKLEQLDVSFILMLCNTAHYFYDELQNSTNVKILNLIEDTIIYLKDNGIKHITLLATTGTVEKKLYQNYCNLYDIKCNILEDNYQNELMDIIYNYIKLGKNVDEFKWNNIINSLTSCPVVLGCTELSIVKQQFNLDERFIDPIDIEINKIIELFKKEKNNG